jgi:hypothetical protein
MKSLFKRILKTKEASLQPSESNFKYHLYTADLKTQIQNHFLY